MEPSCFRHTDKPGKYYCSKYEQYLCIDCLACQDPKAYCKFRKSCFIWEIVKHGTPDMQDASMSGKKEKKAKKVNKDVLKYAAITFLPSNQKVGAEIGSTLLDAAHKGGIYINAGCGGKGVCGSCKVKIESGKVDFGDTPLFSDEDREKGFVLACKGEITGDVTVVVPEANKARALKIVEDGAGLKEKLLARRRIKPLVSVVPLELTTPSLDDASSDLDRVRHGLSKSGYNSKKISISLPVLRSLSQALRANAWKVNIALISHGSSYEIIRVAASDSPPEFYGVALDMGTTSVVACLVDFRNGLVAGTTSAQNRQVVCGEDVISRIIFSQRKDGLERLHDYAISTTNFLIDELLSVTNVKRDDILSLSVAGNTVMTQLMLKLDPSAIRTEPYVPAAVEFPFFYAKEIGINIYPEAGVYIVPGNAAYVGGDITAGILASGLNNMEDVTLFIDVGTNGEMVLGNKEWMMSASCSAGPAFEGGGIRHGMRALPGAIEGVKIDPVTFEVSLDVIDNELPAGICGSGMISLIASLFLTGILDASGKFMEKQISDRLRRGKYGYEFVLAWKKDTQIEEDILITEVDITTLMQSKAAVYAGIMTLLKSAGISLDAINHIQVAGGFGKHIDFELAVIIGMLPDADIKKFEYLGNSSIAGAYLALVSEDARNDLLAISKKMTYVDFSSSNLFYDEYMQALFLPHTDLRSFPGVAKRLKK